MKLTNNLYFYPENGVFDSNTYVIDGNPGILIDPGNPAYLPQLAENLQRDGLDLKRIGLIVNTHLHGDHCAANEEVRRLSGARIAVHSLQKEHYHEVVVVGARYIGIAPIEFREDYLIDGGRLGSGDTELELIHAPGHSPDSICFYRREDKALICGDVVFHSNVGRVDFIGGNIEALAESIEALAALEVAYLLPGHMEIVTGRENVEDNFHFIREHVLKWM